MSIRLLPFAFAKVVNFLKFVVEGKRSPHHRIVNDLPGTPDFCPTIYKTRKLEEFVASNIQNKKDTYINSIHKEVMQPAAASLLLKDSKASFTIEGDLEMIEWEITPDHNVVIHNDTLDYYRYFDVTKQAEFLFDCVLDTTKRLYQKKSITFINTMSSNNLSMINLKCQISWFQLWSDFVSKIMEYFLRVPEPKNFLN